MVRRRPVAPEAARSPVFSIQFCENKAEYLFNIASCLSQKLNHFENLSREMRMSRNWGKCVVLTIAVLLSASNFASAAEWTVAKLSGHVVIQAGPLRTVALANGMTLQSGAVLLADKTGRALLVHGGDQMIVSPNSIIAIPKDDGARTTVLERLGEVELDVSHQTRPHFAVETPFLAALVKGTHFTVRVFKRGASVTVERGRVEVDDLLTGEKVDILAGQTALVQPGARLTISGAGPRLPIIQGTPASPSSASTIAGGTTASLGGAASIAGGASLSAGVAGVSGNFSGNGVGVTAGGVASASIGGGGVGVSAGGVGSASVGTGGITAGVGNVANANVNGNGVGVSAGSVSVGVGSGGISAGIGGGSGHHH
jgi:hypothetical protein